VAHDDLAEQLPLNGRGAPVRQLSLRGSLAVVLCLALVASCTSVPKPTGPEAMFIANCRKMEPTRNWEPSDPPGAFERSLFRPPPKAPPGRWFSTHAGGMALCVPCAAGSSEVQSFEWYTKGFKEGELHLRSCKGGKPKK
jgi:hypothetical protein